MQWFIFRSAGCLSRTRWNWWSGQTKHEALLIFKTGAPAPQSGLCARHRRGGCMPKASHVVADGPCVSEWAVVLWLLEAAVNSRLFKLMLAWIIWVFAVERRDCPRPPWPGAGFPSRYASFFFFFFFKWHKVTNAFVNWIMTKHHLFVKNQLFISKQCESGQNVQKNSTWTKLTIRKIRFLSCTTSPPPFPFLQLMQTHLIHTFSIFFSLSNFAEELDSSRWHESERFTLTESCEATSQPLSAVLETRQLSHFDLATESLKCWCGWKYCAHLIHDCFSFSCSLASWPCTFSANHHTN